MGTFLPKSLSYLPVISTIPGKEDKHGMNITEFEPKRVEKIYLLFHQRRAPRPRRHPGVELDPPPPRGQRPLVGLHLGDERPPSRAAPQLAGRLDSGGEK